MKFMTNLKGKKKAQIAINAQILINFNFKYNKKELFIKVRFQINFREIIIKFYGNSKIKINY